MAEPSFADTLIGQRIGGRYIVDRVLGVGGMGVVTMARYPELGHKVAIKFLHPEHAANAVLNARFVREARLAASVKSEHFVRVFDIGKLPNGVPYLVMELLAGRDLGAELAARGSLAIEEAVDYVLQAMIGVAEIHALGVVHRDLKPANLFLAEAAGKRMIKVLDFGISKERSSGSAEPLTATDNVLGTPQYMSPEQVRASKDVDTRSDIWALGVILYELVTMQRPFVSTDSGVGEIFAKVLYVDPPPPSELRADLPPELEAIILKCLSRDPSARFADVGALAEALRPFVPPNGLHRLDAVTQALTTRQSIVPSAKPHVEDGERPSRLPTMEHSPEAKRDALASSATELAPSHGGAVLARPNDAPVTVMTSSGALVREPESRRGRWVALGVVAACAVGGLSLALKAGKPTTEPKALVSPPPSVSVSAEAPPVPASLSAPAAAPPAAAPPAADSSPALLPSAHASARPTRSVAPKSPVVRPSAGPPPARPASAPATTSDPILDRK